MFRPGALPDDARPSPEGGAGMQTAARERLATMFRDHHQTVWRTLRRWGLDASSAADAGQQAYVVAAERLDDIQRGSERAFLLGTALRIARANFRKANRLQLEEDMDLRTLDAKAEGVDGLSDLQLVDLALGAMEPSLVEVFVLYEMEGLSSPEIALALTVPVGTVASRLRRAREGFRAVAKRIELMLAREGGAR